MIKYLLLAAIVYAYYKFFLAPKKLEGRDQQNIQEHQDADDDEYIDYEEIE
jgi:hypothetical protein